MKKTAYVSVTLCLLFAFACIWIAMRGYAAPSAFGRIDTMPPKIFYWPGAGLMAPDADWAEHDAIAPTLEDDTGEIKHWVASFDDTADEARFVTFPCPPDIDPTGNVTFVVYGYSVAAATSGAVQMYVLEAEVGTSENVDPTFVERAAASTTIDGTADDLTVVSWTVAASALGWVDGDLIVLYLVRDGDGDLGTDSLSGDFDVIGFEIRIPRR